MSIVTSKASRQGAIFAPRQPASEARLDNNANNCGKSSEQSDFARFDRWVARGQLWQLSNLPRLQKCGRVTVRPSGHVDVRKHGDSVGFAGLATCGSVHACPVCSAKIQAIRRLELGVLVSAVTAAGQSLAFGAFTLRHSLGQDLDHLWRSLSYGHARVNQDKTVRSLRQEMGRDGYVRAQEATHGLHGWHPHSHPLVIFNGPVTQSRLDDLAAEEYRAWAAALRSRGLGAPSRDAQSMKLVKDPAAALSEYLVKSVYSPSGVEFEMTGSQNKKGRRGSRTPWQILYELLQTGDAQDLALWHEWERGSKGKRALVWGRGVKERYGIGEQTDEEIAERETGDADDNILTVTDWAPVVRAPELGAGLLAAVRAGGFAAGAAFCDWNGIPYAMAGGES